MFSRRQIKKTHTIDFFTKFSNTELQLVFWEAQPWQIQSPNDDKEFAVQKENHSCFKSLRL